MIALHASALALAIQPFRPRGFAQYLHRGKYSADASARRADRVKVMKHLSVSEPNLLSSSTAFSSGSFREHRLALRRHAAGASCTMTRPVPSVSLPKRDGQLLEQPLRAPVVAPHEKHSSRLWRPTNPGDQRRSLKCEQNLEGQMWDGRSAQRRLLAPPFGRRRGLPWL